MSNIYSIMLNKKRFNIFILTKVKVRTFILQIQAKWSFSIHTQIQLALISVRYYSVNMHLNVNIYTHIIYALM